MVELNRFIQASEADKLRKRYKDLCDEVNGYILTNRLQDIGWPDILNNEFFWKQFQQEMKYCGWLAEKTSTPDLWDDSAEREGRPRESVAMLSISKIKK